LEEVVFAQHVLDESLEIGLADAAEVGDVVEQLPATLRADAAVFEGQGEELVDEDGPAAVVLADAFDPLFGGEEADGDGLHDCSGFVAEEGHVGDAALAAAGAAHALEERGDGAGGVGLEGEVEAADVDAELEGGSADDAGV